jgi:hypothetical protein
MRPSRRDLDEQDFVAGAGFGMTGPRPPRDFRSQDLIAAEVREAVIQTDSQEERDG